MLKRRVIPVLLLRCGRMVKGKRFTNYRDTGDPVSQAKIYNSHNSDELMFLDIEQREGGLPELIDLIQRVSKECFMPLSVGGGIRTIDEIRSLISVGADKVVINSAALSNYKLIEEAASEFGKQAIIVSIDVKLEGEEYIIYSKSGKVREQVPFLEHLRRIEDLGAGEILVNSIDRDGEMVGYDLELLKLASENTRVPVIISGGAGHFEDLYQGLKNGAHAVACGSLFHFGDNNPTRARSFLANKGIPVKNIKGVKFGKV